MQQQCQSLVLYIGLAPSSLLKDPASFSVDVASFMAKLWWEDKASSSSNSFFRKSYLTCFRFLQIKLKNREITIKF